MVGEILKNKREELGRDLREIANTLKIRYDYLKAIEDGDLKRLPAEVYLKGYLLEYAKVLNLDTETIMNTYNQETGPLNKKTDEIDLLQPSKKRFRISYVLVPALTIFLFFIIAKLLFSPSEHPSYKTDVPVINNQDTAVSQKSIRDADNTIKTLVTSGDTTNSESEKQPAVLSEHTLEILATDTTWLSIAIDNAHPQELLMQPGESIKWHAQTTFLLKIGNAGGIRLLFDGEEISKLGRRGQVVSLQLPRQNT